MVEFDTMTLPTEPHYIAPDGSEVRVLIDLKGGGLAHFQLAPGRTSKAVEHRSVEEIWFILTGHGEMWRERDGESSVVTVAPGVCVAISIGTRFQFRSFGDRPLSAVAVTMPPWPGPGEAIDVEGIWQPTIDMESGGEQF